MTTNNNPPQPVDVAGVPELLPCPFCGPGQSCVDLYFDDTAYRYRVGCGRCGWNTRATQPATAPQLAAPSDIDSLLFRVAGKDCESLIADMNECSDDLPFVNWCVVCQARGLIQKYSHPTTPPDIAERARRAVARIAYEACYVPNEELVEAIIAVEFK